MDQTSDQRSPLELSLGLVSPLWPAFAMAASAGAAMWWASRWSLRPWTATNLEAAMTPVLPAPASMQQADEMAVQVAENASENIAAFMEAVAAEVSVAEPMAEAAVDPLIEAENIVMSEAAPAILASPGASPEVAAPRKRFAPQPSVDPLVEPAPAATKAKRAKPTISPGFHEPVVTARKTPKA